MSVALDVSQRPQYSEAEWRQRVELAACYRLIALYGWDDLVFTHISARLPGPDHHFLINRYGMMFDEITASSLVKVDAAGSPLASDAGPVNPAGFVIHSAIHEAREDVGCVLHTHTPAGVALSARREGLLPISQQATIVLTSLGYHDYEGIAVRDEEKQRLQADLATNKYLILRNHGLLTVGASVAEAFLHMFTLERACQIQLLAEGRGELVMVPASVLSTVRDGQRAVRAGMSPAELIWPGALRRLDRENPGYNA